YTSKLKRTIQSVKPFINRGCAFESLDALNEINWGEMEGRQSTPESYADFTKVVTAWRDGNLAHAIGGGETPINLQERQRKGLEYILSKENERQIIIAMHGRAMRSFLCLMMEYPLNLMDDFDHSNLCLYIIQWNGEKFRIKTANDTSHLL
ncbi:MAG: histidine phosphatase family protein, partial [Bacteroidia bacterium]|nr:histidine phosphatase family protein [Bacteroidia bacterium]